MEALQNTIRLAQETDKLGYTRFWVSEHHFSRSLAGSSPEVLISALAANTTNQRIGSGGVMLPHYSSYKVAENFKVLEALFPNRIDLGLGRAPGGTHLATKALQENKKAYLDEYPQQIDDLITYLYDLADENFLYPNLRATPKIETAPELWLLGSSGGSALLAAQKGAGYAFAQFINGEGGAEVVRYYKDRFKPSLVNQIPQTLLAIFVICADTDEESERLAVSSDLAILLIEKGMLLDGLPTPEQARQYSYSGYDRLRIKENRKRMIVGRKEKVKDDILTLSALYETDEIMLVSLIGDMEAKIHSFQLLAQAFDLKHKK